MTKLDDKKNFDAHKANTEMRQQEHKDTNSVNNEDDDDADGHDDDTEENRD